MVVIPTTAGVIWKGVRNLARIRTWGFGDAGGAGVALLVELACVWCVRR